MYRRRRTLLLGLLPALVVMTAPGCSGDGGGGDDRAAGRSGESSSTTVSTVPLETLPGFEVTAKDYSFEMPAVVEGGVVRLSLNNTGTKKHEAVIVAAGDTPVQKLKDDLSLSVTGSGQALPDYLRFHGGVSLVAAGTQALAVLTLPVGKYVMVCTLTDADSLPPPTETPPSTGPPPDSALQFHYDKGMIKEFSVEQANTATMPPTEGTVVARDWSFELPPFGTGAKVFTFRNAGEQDHSLAVAEFPEGVDEAAAKSAFETFLAATPDNPPPENLPVPMDVAFAGPLSGGGQVTFAMDLKPSRVYVFACYMADRGGGELHAYGKRMVAYTTTPAG